MSDNGEDLLDGFILQDTHQQPVALQEQTAQSYYEDEAAQRQPRWATDCSISDKYDLQTEYVDAAGNRLYVSRCGNCGRICGWCFSPAAAPIQYCYNCMLVLIDVGSLLGCNRIPDAGLVRRLYNQDGTCRSRTWRWSLEQSAFMNYIRDTIKKFS